MNILEAFDTSVPELPAETVKRSTPRQEPTLIAREHLEDGVRTVLVMKPKSDGFYRLSTDQWALLQCFDGERSYAEVAETVTSQGVLWGEDEVREFAEQLRDSDLFYRSPADANLALTLEQKRHRKKLRKSKWGDFSDVRLLAWDPDEYLNRLYPYVRFFYTRWFNLLALVAVVFMFYIFTQRWNEIWRDSLEYFTFSDKNLNDLIEFWVLFFFVAFFHESAHGMTCKQCGGNVHSMGFGLMYFMPTFFCDVSEAWIYGRKWQRIAAMIAGIWIELIFCVLVTIIWWNTAPGMVVHDIAYKLILLTGVAAVFLNLNPLVKLDGYFIFSELIGIADIKEKSSAYLSRWVKRHIFRLPVEVPYVPRRRRPLFVAYALASGTYSYLLLYTAALIVYRVFLRFTPKYAVWLGALTAILIFKSRVFLLGRFMKSVYLDKKERIFAWFTPARVTAVTVSAAIILLAPIWPEYIRGRFLAEPAQRAVIRAMVPGTVSEVLVHEGQLVAAGQPLIQLRNLRLESEADRAVTEERTAAARATHAQLAYSSYGTAQRERQQLAERSRTLQEQLTMLQVHSPISGIVVTPRPKDLQGSYAVAGSQLVEVADNSTMLARVYVPEFAMRDLQLNAPAMVHLDGTFISVEGRVASVGENSTPIAEGLMAQTAYEGLRPPQFFIATVRLDPAPALLDNMTGTAKILIGRRSLAAIAWRFTRDLSGRRIY